MYPLYPGRKSWLTLANAALLLLLSICGRATTYYVANSGNDSNDGLSAANPFPTIQHSITAANSGDTIVVAAGTYSEHIAWNATSLTLQGAGVGQSILDGSNSGTCLTLTGVPSTALIQGFTIQNGNSSGAGGGMRSDTNSNPTVSLCAFSNNSAFLGGGMYNDGNPTVTQCSFSNNAAFLGGGMYNDGNPTVTHCSFSNNNGFLGGGMNDIGSTTVTYCSFINNTSGDAGAGMCAKSSSSTVINCSFINNSASNTGGGVFCNSGSQTFTNCLFLNNAAFLGGGMYNFNNSQAVTNCSFSGNSATSGAGGIYNDGSSSPTVTNCILWGDSDGEISGSATVTYSDVQGSSDTTNGNISTAPNFVNAAGGNLQLQFPSPAIDAGDDTAFDDTALPLNITTDLADNPRISRGAVDMGAYEYQDQASVVNAGGNQAVTATHSGNPANDTASLSLNGSATDAQNDALAFTWTDSVNNVVGSSASLSLTLKPGSYTYTLTAADPYGAKGSQAVQVSVNPAPNQAPTANSQSLALNQDTRASITLTGSDPDGDSLTYSVGAPAHGALSGTAPNLTYTPNAGDVGADSFVFTVTDTYGAISIATVSFTIKDTTPPVITLNGSNPMSVNQGSSFVDPGATAVDNVDGPVPVSVSGSVNTAVPGTYTLTYKAADSAGNAASKTRTVNVIAASKLSVSLVAIGQLDHLVGVVIQVSNPGTVKATNIKITSASLIGVNTFLTLPCDAFSLNAGQSQQALLCFYPLKKGQTGTLSVSGTSSLGAFSLSQTVTVP